MVSKKNEHGKYLEHDPDNPNCPHCIQKNFERGDTKRLVGLAQECMGITKQALSVADIIDQTGTHRRLFCERINCLWRKDYTGSERYYKVCEPNSFQNYPPRSCPYKEEEVVNFYTHFIEWINRSYMTTWVCPNCLHKTLIYNEETRHFECCFSGSNCGSVFALMRVK
jgi:predicted RNA-binding Zn-ribbon protein involved in translation (DUF1610 family)